MGFDDHHGVFFLFTGYETDVFGPSIMIMMIMMVLFKRGEEKKGNKTGKKEKKIDGSPVVPLR